MNPYWPVIAMLTWAWWRRWRRGPQPTAEQLRERAELLEQAVQELAQILGRGYQLWAYAHTSQSVQGVYLRLGSVAELQRYMDKGYSMAVFALHPRYTLISEVRQLLDGEDWDTSAVFQSGDAIFLGDINNRGQVLWGIALSFLLGQDLWPYPRRVR